jgi:phosphoenolpyruvate---glycerone phosphotransferase subunit DhaL
MIEAETMIDARDLRRNLIKTVAERIIGHADELTSLDQAIGDGDHGINMKRGMDAVMADLDKLAEKPLGEALKAAGMYLVTRVGGASGPLYGTLFMSLGKGLADIPDREVLAVAFRNAVDAVRARGKSDRGMKTMLDVLLPLAETLESGGVNLIAGLRKRASEAAEATKPLQAIRGRASFLGERSKGHLDPGARSSQLMIEAVCDVIEGKV